MSLRIQQSSAVNQSPRSFAVLIPPLAFVSTVAISYCCCRWEEFEFHDLHFLP